MAIRLGGRSRRRGPYRAALDGNARISVHRLRQQQRDLSDRRAALQCGFLPARAARGGELPVRQRCGSGDPELDRGRRAGCGSRQFSRAGHVRLARLSADPISLCRRQQPARQRLGPRDHRCHALCRRAAVAWRRSVDRSGDRPGFWLRQHARRGRISERRGLQARVCLPVRPPAALFRPPDHRSRRRDREGGARHPSVRRLADGEPPGADGRQVRRRRPLRHQQIREQSERRFPELVPDQCRDVGLCRRRLGLHLRRRRRMVPGTLYAARRDFRSVGNPGRRDKPPRGRSRSDVQAVPARRRA